MDVNFSSISELYDRVKPALKSKALELKKLKMDYIKEVDIWNCLVELRWKNEKGLVLADIVDDILNIDNKIINNYVKEKIKKVKNEVNTNLDII